MAVIACAQDDLPGGRLISSRGIAFNARNGKVYAVDQMHDAIWVIDSRRNSPLSVKVGSGPDAIAVNRITGKVYVANSSDGSVSEIDGTSNAVTSVFRAGSHPYMLAVNEATNKVYLSNTFSNAISEIDVPAKTSSLLEIGAADNIAIDSHSNRIFLIGYEDANVRIMNGSTGLIQKTAAEPHLWGMAVDEASGAVLVTEAGSRQLLMMNPATGEQWKVSVGAIPCAVAANSLTKKIYVVNYGDNSVSVLQEKRPVATVPVGAGPQAIAVDARINRIYIANTHGNSVTVIDGQTNGVVATIPAGRNPYAITTGLNTHTVYVANFGDPSFMAVTVGAR